MSETSKKTAPRRKTAAKKAPRKKTAAAGKKRTATRKKASTPRKRKTAVEATGMIVVEGPSTEEPGGMIVVEGDAGEAPGGMIVVEGAPADDADPAEPVRVQLPEALTIDTAASLYDELTQHLGSVVVELDAARVSSADTAGLQVLVAWLRASRALGNTAATVAASDAFLAVARGLDLERYLDATAAGN